MAATEICALCSKPEARSIVTLGSGLRVLLCAPCREKVSPGESESSEAPDFVCALCGAGGYFVHYFREMGLAGLVAHRRNKEERRRRICRECEARLDSIPEAEREKAGAKLKALLAKALESEA